MLLEVIDETLLSLLGQRVKDRFYLYLNSRLNIDKQEIPFRIEDFIAELERVFGAGARYLEFYVVRELQARVKFVFPISVEENSTRIYLQYLREKWRISNSPNSLAKA
jgi:hypothetical protein